MTFISPVVEGESSAREPFEEEVMMLDGSELREFSAESCNLLDTRCRQVLTGVNGETSRGRGRGLRVL